MLFFKRWLIFLAVGVFIFTSFVSAIDTVRINNSDTSITLNVTSASNLYAYEAAFDYSTSVNSPTFSSFLGAGTTSGSSSRNGIFTVYESKQDGTTTGTTGSGSLFTLTFSGTVSLRYFLAVYGDGSSEYVYYNNSGSSGSSNATTSSSSGGGGGGGGSTKPTTPSADLSKIKISSDPPELALSVVAGKSLTREVKIKNSGTIAAVLTITTIGFKDITAPKTLTLAAGEEKTISISFGGLEEGVSAGQISFSMDGTPVYSLLITGNSRSDNFLFDSSLTLASNSRTIRSGNKITAQIDLHQIAKPTEKVDVVATYIVKDYLGVTFLEESETFSVLGDRAYEKEFSIPDLPPGKYILGLEITYPGAFATTTAQFQVDPPFWSINPTTIILVGAGVMVVLFAGAIIWATRRKRLLYKHNKK